MPEDNENSQITLRDTIEEVVSSHENNDKDSIVTNKIEVHSDDKKEVKSFSDLTSKEKDDRGRFVSKQSPNISNESVESSSNPKKDEIKRPDRPSSWKKEYWNYWDNIDPKLASYLVQREQEFSRGVSTYKNEWEQAKPLLDAIAPFSKDLQQNNIHPTEWINTLGNAHKILALGSPEQKLSMFMKLAGDYKVPVQKLFSMGQDGNVYFNPQVSPLSELPQQQQDITQVVKQLLQEERIQKEVEEFSSSNDKYPYFEQVRETMAGLLQAGLAHDLKSAYEAALRIPVHSDILEKIQSSNESKKREDAVKLAVSARAKAVSPRSSTPISSGGSAQGKGLRSMLEDIVQEYGNARV